MKITKIIAEADGSSPEEICLKAENENESQLLDAIHYYAVGNGTELIVEWLSR